MRKYITVMIAVVGMMFIQATPPELNRDGEIGMKFFEGSWEEALAQAKEEDKLIFLDAYASWCGPCKLLKRNVFTQETVGDLYNESFINYAMDMEKGQGPLVARQYRVTAYPTLLFVDGDGNVVKKAVGYHPTDHFLALGKEVLSTHNAE